MIKRCETKHNQHRRSYWHDYYQKGLYMITMVIDGRKPLIKVKKTPAFRHF